MGRILAWGASALLASFSALAQDAAPAADAGAPSDASSPPPAPAGDAPPASDAPAAPAPDASAATSPDASPSPSNSADTSASGDAGSSSTSSSSSTTSSDSSSAANDSSAGASDSSSASSTLSGGDSGGAEAASAPVPADTKPGFPLYIGIERDQVKVEFENDHNREKFGERRMSADFYKARLGVRLFQGVGLELQGGAGENHHDGKIKDFAGLYLVPTAVALDFLEVSLRIGYSYMDVKNSEAKGSFDGMSYGAALELPLRSFGESLPNFRLTFAGMVYSQDHKARNFGWTGGLRYDFNM